ncbi:MAG: hypothetical protein KBF66_15285 [Rhodoferax sp.]|uniref:DUF5681 domain-containing protein n=1 Tax=Rhodoferax sp. TaxID=50421 RepID=UPI001B6EAAAF|nr:DUF5681 domain-containing protein [Rhodoferax sp.]MBP9906916.1 hypothetical protein [Rhodoferax sp.]
MVTTTSAPKKPGRWQKGESGNPRGRIPGTGEIGRIRASISAQMPELLNKLLAQAMAGDVGASRLLLERCVPPLKSMEPTQALNLPNGSLTTKGEAILAAVAAGTLGAGQGSQLIAAIGGLAKVAEFDKLQERVAILEQRDAKP